MLGPAVALADTAVALPLADARALVAPLGGAWLAAFPTPAATGDEPPLFHGCAMTTAMAAISTAGTDHRIHTGNLPVRRLLRFIRVLPLREIG
jgi:hypothetical protein